MTQKGNAKDTISDRKTRANASLSEIRAILKDVPLGNQRNQIGILLRQALFINGCLVNSEVWCGYSDNDLKDLEVIDHQILRAITGAQAKVPTEMLYLETGQVTIKSVISARRLLYLHNILQRHESELIRKIYIAMREDPLRDDWIHLVQKDMKDIDLTLSDNQIEAMSKSDLKKLIKNKIRISAKIELELVKQEHSKVRHIIHKNLNAPQNYLTNPIFTNKQTSLLFNLRSQCVNEFRGNFYPSICQFCRTASDSQEHALSCHEIRSHMKKEHKESLDQVKYSDIFSDTNRQHKIV